MAKVETRDRDGFEAKEKKKKDKMEDKTDEKHLVARDGRFRGVLFRNSEHRKNARTCLENAGFYDAEDEIRKGVCRQSTVIDVENDNDTHEQLIVARIPKYKYEYNNADLGEPYKNFVKGGRPYPNESHHVLVCELFYDPQGWDEDTLQIVAETGYDINNEMNIIYLPYFSDSCHYHALPYHSDDDKYHKDYNKRVLRNAEKILNKAKKAVKQKKADKCEEKEATMAEIYDLLTGIEDEFFDLIVGTTPGEKLPGLPG